MRKTLTSCVILLILAITLVACDGDGSSSSNNLPPLTEEASKILSVGIYTIGDIVKKWENNGYSYANLSQSTNSTEDTVYLVFSGTTDTTDLSSIDSSLGVQTVTITGQIIANYENLPSIFPYTLNVDVLVSYSEGIKSIKADVRYTSASTCYLKYCRVSGVEYKPQAFSI